MKAKLSFLRATAAAAAAFAGWSGAAAEELVVKTDQTQILKIDGSPGTVIVGNPSFADVTVHGKQIFVHGRAFGTTNLIVLDETGNELVNYELTVMQSETNSVGLFKAGSRYSLVCAPNCEGTLQVGDNSTWFGLVSDGAKQKTNLATGKTSAETQAPAAAQ